MIKHFIIATAIALLLTGCVNTIEKQLNPAPASSTDYTCTDGKKLSVTYFPTGENVQRRARIQFEGAQFDLERVPSASGEKYSDGKHSWWAKGSSGFFEKDNVITMRDCISQEER